MAEPNRLRIDRFGILGLVLAISFASILTSGCSNQMDLSILAVAIGYGPIGFIDKSGNLVIDLAPYHPRGYVSSPGNPNEDLNVIDVSDFSDGASTVVFSNDLGITSGLLNEDGKLTLFPGKRRCYPFLDGVAEFQKFGAHFKDTAWGFTNRKGDTLIKPTFMGAHNFSEGLAAVCVESQWGSESWCYIDKLGKRAINKTFESASDFSEGLASVKVSGKFGAIDKSGREIVPAKFDRVYAASDGVVVAESGAVPVKEFGEKSTVKIERIYFDTSGKQLFTKNVLVTWKSLDCKIGPVVSNGSWGRPIHLRNNPSFFNGLAIVQDGTKYGYINKKGAIVIPATYDFAFPFSENIAAVYSFTSGGKIAFIDRSGKRITPFKYGDATEFSEGLAAVTEFDRGPYGFIDTTGKCKIWPIFCAARKFKEGRALVGWPF